MYVCDFELQIGRHNVPAVNYIEVEKSRDTIPDYAVLQLPAIKNLKEDTFKEKDNVEIKFGYKKYGLSKIFTGIITKISPTLPLEIRCEDYLYYYKYASVTKFFGKMYDKEIIEYLSEGIDIDLSLVKKRFKKSMSNHNRSKRWILERLAKAAGYDCFVHHEKLYFGEKYGLYQDQKDIPVFEFENNIIENYLTYSNKENIGKVIVISEATDGTGIVKTGFHGKDGVVKKFYFDDLDSDEVKQRAKEIYDDFNYEGFKGDFMTFGYPFVEHSMKIKLKDKTVPKREGIYRVDQVFYEFGDGIKQTITLGEKVE